MNRATDRRIRAVLAAFVAGFLLVIAASAWTAYRQQQQAQWVAHTEEVRKELDATLAAVTALESSYRGYAITGDPTELEQAAVESTEARSRASHVQRLVEDNREQDEDKAELARIIDRKVELARVSSDNPGSARALVLAGQGRQAMRELQGVVRRMLGREDALLARRTSASRATTHQNFALCATLAILFMGGAAGFYRYLRRTITAREEALLALQVSEERFRALVDGVRDYAIFMIDPKGTVLTWSEGARRTKGYAPSEIVGRSFKTFYPPEDVAAGKPERELELAARDGRAEDEGYRVRKDGSAFWANVVITAIRDVNGELLGFAKITRDLTDRRTLEQERVALIEQLQRSNGELQEFAMIASHDLQEPLRKIQMFGDRLAEDCKGQLDERGADYLARMQRAAARGQSLVQGLLAYSRVTTKGKPFVNVDLNEVAADVASDLEARLADVHGRIEIDPLPRIEADALQMRQLIQNLVGNALKFHKDGVEPVVHIAGHDVNGQVELVVEDNGIGFDEKYLDRIFKLFQRLHERGAYEGSGMGLAICRKIAERHGGGITAQSAPGEGARFIVRLRARASEKEAA